MKPLTVLYVKAENVGGIRQLEVTPGKVTEISGDNGTGKSSAVAVFKNALGGGQALAQLARLEPNEAGEWVPTAEPPRIVMLLGEAGKPHEYEVEVGPKDVSVKKRVGDSQGFEAVKKPRSFLSSLADGRGSNPVQFIALAEMGREKELSSLILETLPLAHQEEKLAAILGDRIHLVKGREMLAKLHPIEEIALTREAIFAARTGVNGSEREKRATAEDLLKSIPAYVEDTDAIKARLEASRAELASARDLATGAAARWGEQETARKAEALARLSESTKQARLRCDMMEAEAKAAYDLAMKQAKDECVAAEVAAQLETSRTALLIAADKAVSAANISGLIAVQHSKADMVAALEADLEKVSANATLEKRAIQATVEADTLLTESKKLSKILDDLDSLSRSLADEIPIPGLVIKPGKITLNGIPIHQQNTAELAKFAVRVSMLRTAGTPLPWVVVDGIELLGTKAFEALKEELEAVPNIQVFMARVEDHAIEIRSGNEIVGEAVL